jgi:hypothetical protein
LEQAGDNQVIVESDPYSAFQPTYTIDVWESMDDSDCHGKEQPFHFRRYFYQEWLARCKIVRPELLRKNKKSGGGLMKEF